MTDLSTIVLAEGDSQTAAELAAVGDGMSPRHVSFLPWSKAKGEQMDENFETCSTESSTLMKGERNAVSFLCLTYLSWPFSASFAICA
jgi:hypothetical protein